MGERDSSVADAKGGGDDGGEQHRQTELVYAAHPGFAVSGVGLRDGVGDAVAEDHVKHEPDEGALVDLSRVAPAARDAGAALVIDASQSLGALPLDLDELRPAAVVAVGYKWLLGPFSVGYLYLSPDLRDGEPLEENWISRAGSEDFARLVDYTDSYLPGARRFDVGQRTNFGLIPMAVAALEQILAWGIPNIAASLQALTDDLDARITSLGFTDPPSGPRAPHILGLPIPREAGSRILEALQSSGVSASVRGASLRLAPHLHIDGDDCDRLIEALTAAFDGRRPLG
jgi:selenocysteine lyase/cysteine desulfurase